MFRRWRDLTLQPSVLVPKADWPLGPERLPARCSLSVHDRRLELLDRRRGRHKPHALTDNGLLNSSDSCRHFDRQDGIFNAFLNACGAQTLRNSTVITTPLHAPFVFGLLYQFDPVRIHLFGC